MKYNTIIKKLVTTSRVGDKDYFEVIKQLLELNTSMTDKELNSHLLHKLIEEYAVVERHLKTANQELSKKNAQIQVTLEERDKAFSQLEIEQDRTKKFAALLKKMFGRYLSAEVMEELIENPSSLELGGEKRHVTIMMSDLRGFTAICERLKPEQVVQMLNGYCKIMMEVVDKYHGTVNEIIGDTLLIIFGAPKKMYDRTQRAVACALEMQNAMTRVNHHNSTNGLPELEMGIGLNDTEVIVGNIGSDKRSKYSVVGSGVNLTSRIESYTVGGQILISESVYNKLASLLSIEELKEVYPKGSEIPLRIYEVVGISEPWNIILDKESSIKIDLDKPIQLNCRLIEGKAVKHEVVKGSVVRLSKNELQIKFPYKLDIFTNLQMNLADAKVNLSSTYFFGKVIRFSDENMMSYTVRFTSVPSEIKTFFQALRLHHSKRET